MSSTITTYKLNASNRDFVIPFEYLVKRFVYVALLNANSKKDLVAGRDYTFSSKNTITTTQAYGETDGYTHIEIRRITSVTDKLVDFIDGSILRADNLNISYIQALHIAEEARDLSSYTLGLDDNGMLDARGRRIVNLGQPIEGTDASDFKSINALNPISGVQTVDSINDLRALEPTTHGELVYVKAYHSGSLKGGGYFYHDSSSQFLNDDGITSFITTGDKKWVRVYSNLTVYDGGCLEDRDSSFYIEQIETSGFKFDGLGATIPVNSIRKPSANISNVAYIYNNIKYVSSDFYTMTYSQVTKTGYYSCWTQDKTFKHEGVLYCPFMLAFGHRYDDLRIAWVRSFDDGETWDTPRILVDYHPNNPTTGYHCFSMGVVDNRLFMMVEERTVSTMKLTNVKCYSRPLTYSRRMKGGIQQRGNTVTVDVPEHGLFMGDYAYFSGTGLAGMSGRVKVSRVVSPDILEFTVSSSNDIEIDPSKLWDFGVSFDSSNWKIQSLGSFQISSTVVTHIHSFTQISNKRFIVGAHWGDASPRKLGFIDFTIDWSTGNVTPIIRTFSDEISVVKGEPCVRYYQDKLYISTRSQGPTTHALFIKCDLTASDVEYFKITNNCIHYTPLPFQIVDDRVYMFGTERAEGEWETGKTDSSGGRLISNNPRTMLLSFDLKDFGKTEAITTTCVYQGIQKGEFSATACGVGSVIYKEGYLYYLFDDEDYRHSHGIMENSRRANDACIDDGYQPEIHCIKIKVRNVNKVGDSLCKPLTGVDNVTLPVFRDVDGYRVVQCGFRINGYTEVRALTSNTFIASNSTGENSFGLYGTDYNKGLNRVYLSSSHAANTLRGSLLTLHNDKSSKPNGVVIQGDTIELEGVTSINKPKLTAPPRTLDLTKKGEYSFTYISDTEIKLTMRGDDGKNRAIILKLT